VSHRAVVITISDRCSRGEAEDLSGPAIIERLAELDATLIHRQIVPDDLDTIRQTVATWLDRCDVILTTGGTGLAARDVTPEAIEPLLQRRLPGFGEIMRLRACERTPLSVLSRGGAGTAGRTLIVWLPGSPQAVTECLRWLAPAIHHACELLRGEQPH
jgi:molybdenum cofactor synthesis domain-containing protein